MRPKKWYFGVNQSYESWPFFKVIEKIWIGLSFCGIPSRVKTLIWFYIMYCNQIFFDNLKSITMKSKLIRLNEPCDVCVSPQSIWSKYFVLRLFLFGLKKWRLKTPRESTKRWCKINIFSHSTYKGCPVTTVSSLINCHYVIQWTNITH